MWHQKILAVFFHKIYLLKFYHIIYPCAAPSFILTFFKAFHLLGEGCRRADILIPALLTDQFGNSHLVHCLYALHVVLAFLSQLMYLEISKLDINLHKAYLLSNKIFIFIIFIIKYMYVQRIVLNSIILIILCLLI